MSEVRHEGLQDRRLTPVFVVIPNPSPGDRRGVRRFRGTYPRCMPARVPAEPAPGSDPDLDRGPVLALDLGASRIRAAVVDAEGRVVVRRDGRTPGADGPDAVVAA
jgi:hypothetical protein